MKTAFSLLAIGTKQKNKKDKMIDPIAGPIQLGWQSKKAVRGISPGPLFCLVFENWRASPIPKIGTISPTGLPGPLVDPIGSQRDPGIPPR